MYCSPNCEFGAARAEDKNCFKLEGSIVSLALKLNKISNILSNLNTLFYYGAWSIEGKEKRKEKKRPYRQMAELKR